jgi:hypothetical protein
MERIWKMNDFEYGNGFVNWTSLKNEKHKIEQI